MNVSEWVKSIDPNSLVSEQDVRTKIAVPLIKLLGYDEKYYADEFPIYSYSGRKKNPTKFIDILCFSSDEWNLNRDLSSWPWVQDHSLISIELKKPSESLEDATGQAMFYSMNARSPFYIVLNGIDIKILKMIDFFSDTVIFEGPIENIAENWVDIYNTISFKKLSKETKEMGEFKDQKIFTNYCISLSQQYKEMYRWQWRQYIIKQSKKERSEIYPEVFTNFTGRALVKGDAGSGKTTFLHSIFLNQSQNYINSKSKVIPVLLSGKLWHRSFHSVLEGILKELKVFVPNITIEIVTSMVFSGEILLLIDGIDECKQNRDLLIHDIIQNKFNVIVSSRPLYMDNSLEVFSTYETEMLDENRIIKISSDVLKRSTSIEMHRLPKSMKKILKIPIYFNMFLAYEMDKNNDKVPSNIAELYQSFTNYVLKQVNNKGNSDIDEVPLFKLHNILSEFAFLSYSIKHGKETDITTIIKKEFPNSVLSIYRIFLQSGLIFETAEGCEFQQFSLKEYYYALFITKHISDQLDIFLEKYVVDPNYEEIILLLVGINKDKVIQDKILDTLLVKNLSLYVKCLKRRYNFSRDFEENKDRNFYETFFRTVRDTYQLLVDTYFSNIKKYMLPYVLKNEDADSFVIGVDCSVDINKNSISIELIAVNKGAVDDQLVKISYNDTAPVMMIEKNGKEVIIPYSTLRNNIGFYHYELNYLNTGIDYAREIAIDIIFSNVDEILKNTKLLEFETPEMLSFFIEEFFNSASPLNVSKGNGIKQYNLSLKRQSIDELLDICGGLYKYEINTKNGKKISFGVIWYLLYKNKEKLNLDFDNLLFPTKLEKPIGNGNWVWNYYNDQQIINWIKNYYKYGQESYRKIVEELFPNLRNDLALYQVGPVQYSIKVKLPDRASNDNFSQGSIGTSFCLVDSVKNCNPKMSVVENDTRLIDLDDYHNQLRKEAKFYNRTLS
ncbi:NACHT domain-containing protein, partial [Enterococcus faecium]|nr:NACHT domain-containing protein [Enterococcus faecium]EGP5273145.1 NACHT domain-containing protein [Enterococcus faecium]EHQ2679750.1 NACHT domain-containing protein [Enterococcus faecium]